MDPSLEDKICDLYDLFVDVLLLHVPSDLQIFSFSINFELSYISICLWLQGLDEDAGPQIRKLYAEVVQSFILKFLNQLFYPFASILWRGYGDVS